MVDFVHQQELPGDELFRAGDYEAALAAYDEAANASVNSTPAAAVFPHILASNRALCLLHLTRFVDAVDAAETSIALRPGEFLTPYLTSAEASMKLGLMERAFTSLFRLPEELQERVQSESPDQTLLTTLLEEAEVLYDVPGIFTLLPPSASHKGDKIYVSGRELCGVLRQCLYLWGVVVRGWEECRYGIKFNKLVVYVLGPRLGTISHVCDMGTGVKRT